MDELRASTEAVNDSKRNPDSLRLSVLDQSPISEGSSSADALRNTIDLATLTDELGYGRYWVAEHHGTPMLAGPSPEALIGPIASATSHIRVGSGGIMLPHYSPLKVAENFSVLSALFPGRIDLGIGRAAGTDPLTTFALQRDRRQASPDDFPEQLSELLGYLEGRLPEDHPFARLATLFGAGAGPQPWLLGSSPQSAIWAAELGLPYVFADFINADGAEIAALYRDRFVASEQLPTPRVVVASRAVCADTSEEAERVASSARMAMALLRRGHLIAVPTVETAQSFLAENAVVLGGSDTRRRVIVGDPSSVRAGLDAVATEYGADEVMVVTITHSHAARRRSYELIAGAFALS